MGNTITQVIKEQQEKNNAEVTEALQNMHKMLINKIEATTSQMENAAIEDKSLPIVAVVDKAQKYKIKVTAATSDQISEVLDEILSGDFLDGIKRLVKVGLDQFLGNVSEGETEKRDFHVVFANNSLLRIDYMMYKYEFSSKGIRDEIQNLFCYYLQVGVLDLQKVNPQVLLYELTRAIGESKLGDVEKRLRNLAVFAKDLYKIIHELDRAALGSLSGSGASKLDEPLVISEKPQEKATKLKAILSRYHQQRHAPFFKRIQGGDPSSDGSDDS